MDARQCAAGCGSTRSKSGYGTKSGMTSASDLSNALQENLKLRRELATEVAKAKGEKLAAGRPLSGDRSEPSGIAERQEVQTPKAF